MSFPSDARGEAIGAKKNDTSFYAKQHVIFSKTTRRF